MVLSTQPQVSAYRPFTTEHEMFRKSVRAFVDKEITPYIDEWEAAEIAPLHDLFKKMGQLGFLGLNYDEAYGGANADFWFTVILCEELARCGAGGVPMAITVHTDMCTPALAKYGSHELKQKYLAPAISGDMVGAVAVTEPDAGSDVARIRTSAKREGDEYIINGSKMYITNGTQADWICLLARTSAGEDYHGMSLIIVPTDTPGFIVSKKLKKLGNHSSDTGLLTFENLRVPVSNRIGDEGMGFYYQMEQFQIERLVGAIGTIAGAELAVRQTIKYCQERKAFGKPLIANQWIQFKLGELLTEIEAAKQLNYYCASLVEEAKQNPDARDMQVVKIASMCKLKAGRLAREVADTCLQFYGGMGYMEETPISRYYRDSRLISIGGGADEIMLRIIAQMENMNPR
jgi:citronellyl-CoA dehydrogenase